MRGAAPVRHAVTAGAARAAAAADGGAAADRSCTAAGGRPLLSSDRLLLPQLRLTLLPEAPSAWLMRHRKGPWVVSGVSRALRCLSEIPCGAGFWCTGFSITCTGLRTLHSG